MRRGASTVFAALAAASALAAGSAVTYARAGGDALMTAGSDALMTAGSDALMTAGSDASDAAGSVTPARPPKTKARPSKLFLGAPGTRFATRARAASPFLALPALRIAYPNTREAIELRLYDAFGNVDLGAAERLDRLLCDARDPKHHEYGVIDRRLLQLLFRAAYHFEAREIEVISAFRKPGKRREGLHGRGLAVDFKLPGVKAAELASYLRKAPRVGVGVYTHPRTQYVHLDVRPESFHWLDASPPRRRWREQSLGRIAPAHDAAYRREGDWPEGLEGLAPP